jgi:hypothetical protein
MSGVDQSFPSIGVKFFAASRSADPSPALAQVEYWPRTGSERDFAARGSAAFP